MGIPIYPPQYEGDLLRPFYEALATAWSRLQGVVACPSAAVGSPGQREISQGCILFRGTPLHERLPQVAA